MITIDRLTKRFGEITVLKSLSLAVARGRVTAIVGPNAAGKTTLMKSIVGLIRPDSGSIVVDGVRVNGDERYRANIGYMPQIARFPENMTAAELITLARDLRQSGGHTMTLDEELIGRFGIEAFARKPLRTLSGGTCQKVNAALAFLFAPALLMLDEPTAGLDPISAAAFDELLMDLRQQLGLTVIMITHDLDTIFRTCNRVGVIIDRKMTSDTLEGITANPHPWIQAYFHGERALRFGQERQGAPDGA